MQLAVSYVDPKTGQPQMLHPDWVKIAQTLKNIYSLDGNRFPKKKQWLQFNGYFVREQSVAMGMICASCFEAKDLGFDWDIVSYPVHEDRPRWNANIAGLGLSIDSSCPDIDAAVEAVSYLVSDEHQRRNARSGIRPSLADRRIHMEFGMDSPLYYGKHTASFSQHPPAPPHKNKLERNWNKYHLVREGLIDMISNNLDVHDALHAINQKLAADAPALTI
jgi:ABC-type glycerol-3-phosphate transport system substrate-binding protein